MRAREALIAEALVDCGHLLATARHALSEAQQIARDIEAATAAMTEQREQLQRTIGLYGQTLHTLDKAARERFTATVVEQTRKALDQACAELRQSGEEERRLVAHAAAAAVTSALAAAARAQAVPAPATGASPTLRRSMARRYLDWCASPWGRRATLFMSVLAALFVYYSGVLVRS